MRLLPSARTHDLLINVDPALRQDRVGLFLVIGDLLMELIRRRYSRPVMLPGGMTPAIAMLGGTMSVD
jgi:hypothetical protein